ncbi:MAG: hypothetical protein G8345_20445 [Magnetococcales bacterium]|nr:hypothetical protein [Magnetococcales bacterium]
MRQYCKKRRDSGNALLIVMLAMVLLMGIASAMVEHSATNEANAINESLARIQVHWAMVGQMNYMASRANVLTASNPADDSANVSNMEAYLNDLSIINNSNNYVGNFSTSRRHRWYYPEMGKTGNDYNYFFDIETNNRTRYDGAGSSTVSNFISTYAGRDYRSISPPQGPDILNTNGKLYLLFSLMNPSLNGTLPQSVMLQTIHNRWPSLKVDLCVGETLSANIATGCNPTSPPSDNGFVTVEKMNYVFRTPINE